MRTDEELLGLGQSRRDEEGDGSGGEWSSGSEREESDGQSPSHSSFNENSKTDWRVFSNSLLAVYELLPENHRGKEDGDEVYCVALYDFHGTRDDELESVMMGERIRVIQRVSVDWWCGQLETGEEGLFPANYVRVPPNIIQVN